MKTNFLFEYINENEFRKLERAVKKYNMLAYKKLSPEELTDFVSISGKLLAEYTK